MSVVLFGQAYSLRLDPKLQAAGGIFASGGFSHDPELVRDFLRGIAYGSCEVPTNQGDFLRLAAGIGCGVRKHCAPKEDMLNR